MCAKKFLSTPSARRATIISSIIVLPLSISIHALREEGDIVHGIGESLSFISIHALREEGDIAATARETIHGDFYPRPPRGGRPAAESYPNWTKQFLSTPSARRATADRVSVWAVLAISIHALREEGDHESLVRVVVLLISIHALREEGDMQAEQERSELDDFYPRPPRGGRPFPHRRQDRDGQISIHALREEGDKVR